MSGKPFLWAHRGASCDAPENTLIAFRLAELDAADGLELDVHLSSDGLPVVIHDDTLDRTTNASGRVDGLAWQELRGLDAGGWFASCYAGEPLPCLSEVLQLFGGRLHINIEIKAAAAGEAVLKTLEGFPKAKIVISSFDHALLRVMRRLDRDVPLAVLLDRGNWRRAVALAIEINAQAFHPEASLVSRPLIAACRARKLAVHAWTVDDARVARSLQRAGIDGVFTNDPAHLSQRGTFHG